MWEIAIIGATAHRRAATLLLVTVLLAVRPAAAVPLGSSAAAESLVTCEQADDLSGDARAQALARGMAGAEDALAANDRDALAHFAAVCNLGKQMEAAGIGLRQFISLRRLRRELDAALDLAPDDADVLATKGALLLNLPRLFGGDAAEAEALLRRALAAEPDNNTARCYLARALTERGAADEARALLPHC
jgi:Tetratricopeptide repeat